MPPRTKVVVTQVAIVLALVLIWELGVRSSLIDAFFSPAPSTLVGRIREWTSTPDFRGDVGITLIETILSFVVRIAIGTALGIWLGLSPLAADVVQPFITIFNAIPRILLVPVFVIWFGLGLTSKVALRVTLVLFVAFLNTFQVVRVVLANARLLRASKSSSICPLPPPGYCRACECPSAWRSWAPWLRNISAHPPGWGT